MKISAFMAEEHPTLGCHCGARHIVASNGGATHRSASAVHAKLGLSPIYSPVARLASRFSTWSANRSNRPPS